MDYAFSRTQHDRAAHLRADGAWRTPDLKVMVVGGEHVASVDGSGIRWIDAGDAPDGEWLFLGLRDGHGYGAVVVDRVDQSLQPVSLRML
ncbi:MAG: hypothetical protein WB409_09370, partial [Aeromicrobium sp.]